MKNDKLREKAKQISAGLNNTVKGGGAILKTMPQCTFGNGLLDLRVG